MADVLTNDQTLELIREIANKTSLNNFMVKVQRRKSDSAMPELVAVLEEASVDNFVFPEFWLPQLLGSGPVFILTAYHISDLSKAVGGMIAVRVDGKPSMMKDPDPKLLDGPTWKGPRKLVFPAEEDLKLRKDAQARSDAQYNVPLGGASGVPPQPTGMSGGAVEGHHPSRGSNGTSEVERLELKLRMQLEELERRGQALNDAKREIEIESIKREAAAKEQQLRADMHEVQRAHAMAAAPEAGGGLGSVLKDIAPLALELIKQGREQSLQLANMQMENAKAIAAAQAAAQVEAAKTQQVLMQQLMSKPSIDPVVLSLLNKEDAGAKVMHQMTESIATMSGMMMNVVSSVVEMGLTGHQEEEPHYLKALREVMQGFGGMMMSARSATGGVKLPARKSKQLPPKPEAAAAPAPEQPAAKEPEQAEPQVETKEPVQDAEATISSLEFIAAMIRSDAEPDEVAREIIDRYESLKPAILAVDGDFGRFFEERLGLGDWVEDKDEKDARIDYLLEILLETARLGEAEGVLPNGAYAMMQRNVEAARASAAEEEEGGGEDEEEVVEEEEEAAPEPKVVDVKPAEKVAPPKEKKPRKKKEAQSAQ